MRLLIIIAAWCLATAPFCSEAALPVPLQPTDHAAPLAGVVFSEPGFPFPWSAGARTMATATAATGPADASALPRAQAPPPPQRPTAATTTSSPAEVAGLLGFATTQLAGAGSLLQDQNAQMSRLVQASAALEAADTVVNNGTVQQQVAAVQSSELAPLGDAVLVAELTLRSAQFFVGYNLKVRLSLLAYTVNES
jgi:hypothetical protein